MRIAQVVPAGAPAHSGVPGVISQLAIHLARRDHDVEVWLLRPRGRQQMPLNGPGLSEAGVRIVAATSPWRLAKLAQRDVEIAHLHSVFTPANALLAHKLRVPYVVSPHGGYAPVSFARGFVRKRLYSAIIERPFLRRAALRVALTRAEARDLEAFGAGGPITIIPNGVPPISKQVDRSAFRRELGLSEDALLLVFVGRLDVFHKGLDILIRGVAEAAPWHLALVGPDFRGGADWLLRQSRMLGVDRRVFLTGPRQGRALHEAFAAADLFALTSRWEGFPLSLLEALAHGVPALVSPAVELLLGVATVGAGWSAAPAELGPLLRRLQSLDGPERARRGDAARALAARYDWDTVALRYEAAYAAVLDLVRRAG